jgi:hypothetical protein
VTQEGTSARSFVNAPYKSGGKTGTAQVIEIKANEKYNAAKLDERHRDHALYAAFAPLESPRIALAIVVENAGFGAGAAAPIARRVFDYLLAGQYPSEADIAATQIGQSTAPIGVPRPDRHRAAAGRDRRTVRRRRVPSRPLRPRPCRRRGSSPLPLTGRAPGRIWWRCGATDVTGPMAPLSVRCPRGRSAPFGRPGGH